MPLLPSYHPSDFWWVKPQAADAPQLLTRSNYSRLTTHDSRLTTHDSRLTTHDSRLTTCYRRPTPRSLTRSNYLRESLRLATYYSLLTTYYSLLTAYYSLLSLQAADASQLERATLPRQSGGPHKNDPGRSRALYAQARHACMLLLCMRIWVCMRTGVIHFPALCACLYMVRQCYARGEN